MAKEAAVAKSKKNLGDQNEIRRLAKARRKKTPKLVHVEGFNLRDAKKEARDRRRLFDHIVRANIITLRSSEGKRPTLKELGPAGMYVEGNFDPTEVYNAVVTNYRNRKVA